MIALTLLSEECPGIKDSSEIRVRVTISAVQDF